MYGKAQVSSLWILVKLQHPSSHVPNTSAAINNAPPNAFPATNSKSSNCVLAIAVNRSGAPFANESKQVAVTSGDN